MFVYAIGGLACAAVVCVPLLAQAEGQPGTGPLAVSLEYLAAPDCPDASTFKDITTARLGYDPFRENAPDRILVNIVLRAGAIEGRIEWRDTKGMWVGDRTFRSTGEDCRELVQPMAFALALQIQFLAVVRGSPGPSVSPPTEVGAAAAPPPSPPPIPPVSNPPASSEAESGGGLSSILGPGPELTIGAGALVGFGVSSSPVPFGRLWGRLAWPHRSLELATEVGWPTTTRRADRAGFSQQHLLASIAGCGTLKWLGLCLVAKGGGVRVVGKDIWAPASAWGQVIETGLRLAVMQRLGRHAYVAAQGEGLINVMRWKVTLDQKAVWTSPRFAATVGLDVGVRFP
jgi:hypothetical protein